MGRVSNIYPSYGGPRGGGGGGFPALPTKDGDFSLRMELGEGSWTQDPVFKTASTFGANGFMLVDDNANVYPLAKLDDPASPSWVELGFVNESALGLRAGGSYVALDTPDAPPSFAFPSSISLNAGSFVILNAAVGSSADSFTANDVTTDDLTVSNTILAAGVQATGDVAAARVIVNTTGTDPITLENYGPDPSALTWDAGLQLPGKSIIAQSHTATLWFSIVTALGDQLNVASLDDYVAPTTMLMAASSVTAEFDGATLFVGDSEAIGNFRVDNVFTAHGTAQFEGGVFPIYLTSAGVTGPIVGQGTASPEGAQIASPGSWFTDKTNGNLYLKHTGTGNTGWQLVTAI